jgi:hypothetical protein
MIRKETVLSEIPVSFPMNESQNAKKIASSKRIRFPHNEIN